MELAKLTRQELINNLADLFGYSEDDFAADEVLGEKMTKNDILYNYLTQAQRDELPAYIKD